MSNLVDLRLVYYFYLCRQKISKVVKKRVRISHFALTPKCTVLLSPVVNHTEKNASVPLKTSVKTKALNIIVITEHKSLHFIKVMKRTIGWYKCQK